MIAVLSAAGLDGPITDGNWLQKNIDDQSAATWQRLTNEITVASSSSGHIPFLYVNAHEEDVVFTVPFLTTNPFSGIGFRFTAELTEGWVMTREGLSTYDHGTVTLVQSWATIADGSIVKIVLDGPEIAVFDDDVQIGGGTHTWSQHAIHHGILESWIDLSGRWGDITIDNLPVSDDQNSAVPGSETPAGGSVFARHRPPNAPLDRPQQGLAIIRGPMQIIDGIAVARPMIGASSTSIAYARSFVPTENLGDALSIGANGASSRWLPNTGDIVARPGISSDATEWVPHFGTDLGFLFHANTAPYVDPSYDYWASGLRKKVTQAMVFDGDHWGQSRLTGPDASFTWILALVIHHPKDRTWNDILASPSSAADALAATDATLRYHNGRVQAFVKGKMSDADLHPPLYKARIRPTIIAWAQDLTGGTLGVISASGRHMQSYHHASATPGFDTAFWLGVNGAKVDVDHASEFDVMDICYYTGRLDVRALRKRMNALDHVYGVSGR